MTVMDGVVDGGFQPGNASRLSLLTAQTCLRLTVFAVFPSTGDTGV